ncbi:hypothetical protein [Vulcanisaeta thermophila]|uniref:hypothetical protein n=1 Tax=Vulcanisaeta thermophila TaxID=867917 RepID=UPI001EE34D43|nr:hypothetical protein [Vulcanisaeta thermophila]
MANNVSIALINTQLLILEFMGIKGLFSRDEVDFLIHEVTRIAGMVKANPISREELDFIKSVFSKNLDDITIEELERVEEIAKRWFLEDNSEVALKIFQVAVIARAYKIHERIERERRAREGK